MMIAMIVIVVVIQVKSAGTMRMKISRILMINISRAKEMLIIRRKNHNQHVVK